MATAVAARSSTRLRLLIVEDDPLVASCIEEFLDGSGYGVVGIAASASGAMALAEEHLPDLALVDIRLTGPLDGIELACLLRQKYSVPTIFLTGLDDQDTIRRASIARPLGFLIKPFRPSQVFNAIEQALSLDQL